MRQSTNAQAPKEFTGRHMLIIMLLFFGTIIAVNLIMASYARSSWTGLVVDNSYVASQHFNEKAAEGREQAARQWRAALNFNPGSVSYALKDQSDTLVAVKSVSVTFRRPAYESEDARLALTPQSDGAFGALHAIADGVWIVETSADIGESRPYITSERLVLRGGVVQ